MTRSSMHNDAFLNISVLVEVCKKYTFILSPTALLLYIVFLVYRYIYSTDDHHCSTNLWYTIRKADNHDDLAQCYTDLLGQYVEAPWRVHLLEWCQPAPPTCQTEVQILKGDATKASHKAGPHLEGLVSSCWSIGLAPHHLPKKSRSETTKVGCNKPIGSMYGVLI